MNPGDPVGSLTVIEEAPRGPNRHRMFLCKCICGKVVKVRRVELLAARRTSCGCAMVKRAVAIGHANRTHGESYGTGDTTEYHSWNQMIGRCCNPANHGYKDYGARGITVCERWRNSFEAFLADLGRKPSPQHSLDRYPDNDGNYEPGNVRWATRTEQGRNKRNNKLLAYKGQVLPLSAWAERIGIDRDTLAFRLKSGWTPSQVLTTPVKMRRKIT